MRFVPHTSGLIVPVNFANREKAPEIIPVVDFRREKGRITFKALRRMATTEQSIPATPHAN